MSISSAALPYQEFCSILKFMRRSVCSTFFSRTTWHFIQWLFSYLNNQGWNSTLHKCSTDTTCSKWPCLNKELDQMTSRDPFQPQPFHDSLVIPFPFPCQQFGNKQTLEKKKLLETLEKKINRKCNWKVFWISWELQHSLAQ